MFLYRNNASNNPLLNEIPNGPIKMTATSSTSKIGMLWKLTSKFSNNLLSI